MIYIIIESNLMDNLGIDLNYSDNSIVIHSGGIVNKIQNRPLESKNCMK